MERMNLFENLQLMKESKENYKQYLDIPILIVLGGGSKSNLQFTLSEMTPTEEKQFNLFVNDLRKYNLDTTDIVVVDSGSITGENEQYFDSINNVLKNAKIIKKYNNLFGKSAIYDYNGNIFHRSYDPEYDIDVYNLPKELFKKLTTKTESSKIKTDALNK